MTLIEKAKEEWNALTNTSGRKPEDLPGGVSTETIRYKLYPRLAMKSYLKVKIKSLAEEATIIRHEERRVKRSISWLSDEENIQKLSEQENWPSDAKSNVQPAIDSYRKEYFGLHNHRTYEVRNESRASQLAYAFIQGYPYNRVEDPTKTRKAVPTFRVAELALKYGKVNLPAETPWNKRREAAEKIINTWVRGKTQDGGTKV